MGTPIGKVPTFGERYLWGIFQWHGGSVRAVWGRVACVPISARIRAFMAYIQA